MNAEWRPIPGYAGVYWINRDGRIKNAKGHVLTFVGDKDRPQVELRNNGQREKMFVEQLLVATFGGIP